MSDNPSQQATPTRTTTVWVGAGEMPELVARLPGLPDIELRNSRQQATGSESIALVLSRTLCRYQRTVCGLG